LDIHFTIGISDERSAPLAEKNATAGLSDFSVHGAMWQHIAWQVVQHFHWKFRQ
jgi:hypothetical protein